MRPVVLNPWESDRVTTLARTRIGAFPGWAGISTPFCEKGWAWATSVTEADGTRLGQRVTPLARVGVYGGIRVVEQGRVGC